jgi:hypothetical protein
MVGADVAAPEVDEVAPVVTPPEEDEELGEDPLVMDEVPDK